MAYAIFRTAKLKTGGEIAASVQHCMRTRATPNAIPGVKNKIVWGSANPQKDIDERLANAKGRKNSVKVIEVLSTVSPEWFEQATADQVTEWWKKSCTEIIRTFGKDNVAHLQIHFDESTPHITGYVVPNKDGRLNARHWLGGRQLLSQMQDRMAQCVAHLGIERGVKGSKAKHDRVARFYGAIEQEAPTWTPPSKWEALTSDDWKQELQQDVETMHLQAQAGITARNETAGARATAKAAASKAERNEKEKAKLKAQLDAARATPLLELAQRMALEQDKDQNWKDVDGQFAITITDQKFYDHKAGEGGGGAVDFVKHVMQCDFTTARDFLISNYGADSYVSNATDEARRKALEDVEKAPKRVVERKAVIFQKPEPIDDNWLHVARYLSKARRLSERVINGLYRRGALYADRFKNVVFTSEGIAIKRGTGMSDFKGLAPGSDKSLCWRATVGKETGKWDNLIIAENPIDALSYMQLHELTGTASATAGVATTVPRNVEAAAWGSIIIAYDNDKIGKTAAKKLSKSFEDKGFNNVRVHHPSGIIKDWNEALCKADEQDSNAATPSKSERPKRRLPDRTKSPKPPGL
mgnify:CR=1 FL=1